MIYFILVLALVNAFIIGWLTHTARELSVLKGKVEYPYLFDEHNGLYKLIMAVKNDKNPARKVKKSK